MKVTFGYQSKERVIVFGIDTDDMQSNEQVLLGYDGLVETKKNWFSTIVSSFARIFFNK